MSFFDRWNEDVLDYWIRDLDRLQQVRTRMTRGIRKRSKKLTQTGRKVSNKKGGTAFVHTNGNVPNKRSSAPYPALEPRLNLKIRFEEVDYDYIEKLSPKEKAWLNAFTEEYVHANMKHRGKKLHKTKAAKKICFDRNNSRNRCILSKAKALGMSSSIEELKGEVEDTERGEDD